MFCVKDLSNSLSSIAAGSTATVDINLHKCDTSAEMCVYYVWATTSSYTITMHGSMDGLNYHDVVNAYNVSVGAVAVAADATAHTRCVQLTPVYMPYVRFAVLVSETASTFTTFKVSYQEV